MYLTNTEYGVEDFLKSLQFIAPPGTSVAYFISPRNMGQLPIQAGFQAKEKVPDNSIVYVHQPPAQKQDQATTPAEYSVFDPPEMGRRQPTPNILPDVTEPEDLDCPFIQVLSESKMYGTDIKLIEDYNMFPKNTLFHCVPNKIKEMWLPFSAPKAASKIGGMIDSAANRPSNSSKPAGKQMTCKCGVQFERNPITKSKNCPKCDQYLKEANGLGPGAGPGSMMTKRQKDIFDYDEDMSDEDMINAIVEDYMNDELTYSRAKVMLQNECGLSRQEAEGILDGDIPHLNEGLKDVVLGREKRGPTGEMERDWGRTKRRWKAELDKSPTIPGKIGRGIKRFGHEMFGGDVWDDIDEDLDMALEDQKRRKDPDYVAAMKELDNEFPMSQNLIESLPLKTHTLSAKWPPTAKGWRDFYRHTIPSNRHNTSTLQAAMKRFQNTHGFSDRVKRIMWRIENGCLMERYPGDEVWHTIEIPREEREIYMNMVPSELEELMNDLDKYKEN